MSHENCNFKGLSQDGRRAEFSKNLRASLLLMTTYRMNTLFQPDPLKVGSRNINCFPSVNHRAWVWPETYHWWIYLYSKKRTFKKAA
jgi:hypothetical protein